MLYNYLNQNTKNNYMFRTQCNKWNNASKRTHEKKIIGYEIATKNWQRIVRCFANWDWIHSSEVSSKSPFCFVAWWICEHIQKTLAEKNREETEANNND